MAARTLALAALAAVVLAGCRGTSSATVGAASGETSTATSEAATVGATASPAATPSPSPTPTASPGDFVTSTPVPAEPLAFVDALEPDDGAWSQPYGVDVASDGTTWVLDTGNHRLLAFDADGRQVVEVGGPGSDPGQFDTLGFGALAVSADDEVFVVDNGNGRVQVFGPDGEFRRQWGAVGDGQGQFRRAIGIAVDDAGKVYVTDDERPEVQVFDDAGVLLRTFGKAGDGPGGLVHATGIDVDGSGTAWVADYQARRIQAFGPEGSEGGDPVALEIPGPIGTTGTPEGIVTLDDGRIWVTSYGDGEVLQLLPDSTASTEDPDPWPLVAGGEGIGEGTFQAPVDLAVAPDGTLVVTDQRANTVQRFRPAG